MERSLLYFATRSPRQGAPVLIYPAFVATAISSDRRVTGLAAPVRDDRAVRAFAGYPYDLHGFGKRSDLVRLYEHGIGDVFANTHAQSFGVCYEQIVAYQRNLRTELRGELFPSLEIVLAECILDRGYRIFRAKRRRSCPLISSLVKLCLDFREKISVPVLPLRRRHIERNLDFTGISRLIDRIADERQRLPFA